MKTPFSARIAVFALFSILAVFGVLVALRAWMGPFAWPVRVASPMNVESIFGLAAVLLLSRAAGKPAPGLLQPPAALRLADAAIALGLMAFVGAAFFRALHFYFLSDDFYLVRVAHNFELTPLFTRGGGDGFFRPIGYMSLTLDALWAGLNPALWRVTGVVLHAANSVLLALLAFRLGHSRPAAVFAGALFAVHGARPEAAIWTAARFDLLSTLFALSCLLCFMRSESESARRPGALRTASVLLMALAILSKEAAYMLPALLALYVAVTGLKRQRLRSLIPHFAVAAGLFAYRWVLFGSIGGYQDARTGAPQILHMDLLHSVEALAYRIWSTLFFPINWTMQPGHLLAGFALAAVLAFGWLAWRGAGRRGFAFPVGFLLLCALPPLHMLLLGPDLWKSRLLYLPSAGFCLMLAAAFDRIGPRARVLVACAVLGFNVIALQHNLQVWERASNQARTGAEAAAACAAGNAKVIVAGLPGIAGGVPVFAQGFADAIQLRNGVRPASVSLLPASAPLQPEQGACVMRWDEERQTFSVIR